MSSSKNLYEVFDAFEKATNKEEKKQVLRDNNSFALRSILRANFHPRIRFLFEKIPPYKRSDMPIGMGYSSIDMEINRMYLFEKDNPAAPKELTQQRRELLLIQILEVLESREADIFAAAIMKNLKVRGLTKALVMEVFADIEN